MNKEPNKLAALDALKRGAEAGSAKADIAKSKAAKKPTASDIKPHTSPRKTLTQVKPQVRLGLTETKYFNAVADFLSAAGLLEVVDSLLLTMLAQNYATWKEISEDLTPQTRITVLPNGIECESAMSKLARDAENQIMKISGKLGLSPADRSKMLGALAQAEAAKSKKQDDDLDQYLS